MVGGRALKVIAALTFVLLVAGPVVPLGQAAPADASPVLAIRLRASTPIDVTALRVIGPANALPGLDCSDAGAIDLDGNASRIRFHEGPDQGGCAEVRAAFDLPPHARTFAVRFAANRSIVAPIEDNPFPSDFIQALRLYANGTSSAEHEREYFSRYTPSQPELQEFEFSYAAPAGRPGLEAAWWFFDNAITTGPVTPTGIGDEFAAVVQRPEIVFPDRALPEGAAAFEARPSIVEGNQSVVDGVVALTLTADDVVAHRVFVDVDIAAAYDVIGVHGPDGDPMEAGQVLRVTAGLKTTVTLGPLAPGDAGTYTLATRTTTPLPPEAPPAPPNRVDPLAWGALALPSPLAVAAFLQAHRYRTGAERSQRLAVAGVIAAFTVACVGYLLVLASVAWRHGFDHLAVLPVPAAGWRAYLGLAATAFAFLLVILVAASERARAKDLRHAHELERSNRDLEAFASAASHDLQEPLRDVQNSLLLFDEQHGRQVPRDGRELLREAERGAGRMRDLVRGVLAYAQADAVHFADVPLDGVVASARAMGRTALADAKARVEVGPLPVVHGDAGSLARVFENLLTNAAKFHDPRRPLRIRVDAQREGRMWRVRVADNGTGVPPEHRDRVFRLFERLHGSDVPGAGLGLALCARIVERHGGRIGIGETPGGGATVHLTLPAAQVG